MKSPSLIKYTTSSDTRKNLLYKLAADPMSLTEIREHFHVTSSTIIPRIKDLVKLDLVAKENGKYRLTTTGMILSKKLRMMDQLEGVIEKDGQFLNEHDLSPIPVKLLDRIDELGDCKVIKNELEHITATHDRIYTNIPNSKYVLGISPALNPAYPEFYLAMVKQGMQVSLILTENVFKTVERDYSSFLKAYLSYDNAKMYVTNEARIALVVTDRFMSMYLYGKNGTLDPMSSLLSFDTSAVNWGAELFEAYLKKSKKIKRLV